MPEIKLGILGGGQLGSMLSVAARKINIKTIIYCDDQEAPAQNFCDEFIYGEYDNKEKIYNFSQKVDIITFEFENIPFKTLNELSRLKTVSPKPSIIRLVQHRLTEKDFVNNLNIRTTRYVQIECKEDLLALEDFLPGILKTTTMGYDGKGQYPIKNLKEIGTLNIDFKNKYILEKLVKLKKEISVVITRFNKNKYEIYEPIENTHQDQILRNSKIPAEINKKLLNQSKEWAIMIAEELEYIGTLCVEFFIDRNDNLYVNEIAPRVHNSGHLTINAYNVSQFENHVRAVCGLEQIRIKKLSNAKMINLIGNQISHYRKSPQLDDNEFFFDYLKKEVKEKRKMGHITILSQILKSIENNFENPKVHELLVKHFIELKAASPEESVHVLDILGLKDPSIKFWSLWKNDDLIGCGALKFINKEHGEFKSIRIHDNFRKQGYGIKVVGHLINEAKKLDLKRLSIETGAGDFFKSARKLFNQCGFEICEPFAHYKKDINSVYLTKSINNS